MAEDHEHDHDHGHDHEHEHEHDHGHDHRSLWSRLRHGLAPHSHDAADSIDSELEASEEGIRALKISLVVLLITAIVQAVVVIATDSVALLADTIHNFSDALTALPLWVAFTLARRKPTSRYTYGYGRAEDLAGIFIVLVIAASAVLAGYESIQRLIDPRDLTHPWVVIAAGVVGFLGNEMVAGYRIRVGKRIGSAALVADGLHARTDGFTSLAVVVGATGSLLGMRLADPIVGLVITVAIAVVLRGAARDIYRRLMDAVEPELVEQAQRVVTSVPGVTSVESIRLRWIGHRLRAEVSISADAALDLVSAHRIANDAHHELLHAIGKLDDVTVHVSPSDQSGTDYHADLAHHR